jgi:hypothetical protein
MIVLRPTILPRESILLYGPQATGKSSAILSIARKVEGDFYVVDTDYSYDRLLATEFTDLADRVHVNYVDDQDWANQLEVAESTRAECGDDDWFAYDSTTPTWDAVQAWFTEQVYGKDEAQWYIDMRTSTQGDREKGKKNPVDRLNDDKWPTINKQYKKLHRVFMPGALPGRRGPYRGHMILTCEATKTSAEFDDKDTKNIFSNYGYKPKGQKRVPYLVATVILLNKLRSGGYEATSIKDRGREEFEDLEISSDFADWYLRRVAKWRMTKVEG